jgi:hypothetical protein
MIKITQNAKQVSPENIPKVKQAAISTDYGD